MSLLAINQKQLSPKSLKREVEQGNEEVLKKLDEIHLLIESANSIFEYVTDPELIDGIIYELNSLHKKYSFYIRICKERGIVSAGLNDVSI